MNTIRNVKIVLKNSIMSHSVRDQIAHSNKNLINLDSTSEEDEEIHENFTDIIERSQVGTQINKTKKVRLNRSPKVLESDSDEFKNDL